MFERQLHLRPLIQNVSIRCLAGLPQAHALSTNDAASSDHLLEPTRPGFSANGRGPHSCCLVAMSQLLHYPWKYLEDLLGGGGADVVIAVLASHSGPKLPHKVEVPLIEV